MENDKSQDLRSDSAGWETHGSGWSISDGKPRSRSQLECSQAERNRLAQDSQPFFVLFRPSAIDQGPPPLGRKSALHNLLILNINFMKNTFTEMPISMLNQISEHLWLSQVDTKLAIILTLYVNSSCTGTSVSTPVCVSICVCTVCVRNVSLDFLLKPPLGFLKFHHRLFFSWGQIQINIKVTILKYTIQWVFGTPPMSYNNDLYLVSKHIVNPKETAH